MKDCINTRYTN